MPLQVSILVLSWQGPPVSVLVPVSHTGTACVELRGEGGSRRGGVLPSGPDCQGG